jgi:phage tail sheath gpL-like
MSLNSIGDQKTPGRPIETTFEADTGTPSANQELLLIGHAASGTVSGTQANYKVITISAVSDSAAAKTEAETKFGVGSELSKMVIAAVKANEGGSTFPAIKCVKLAYTDADFGAADAALTAVKKVKAEFVVSPYDGKTANATLTTSLKTACSTMSGAQRVENNQFGTIGVIANQDVTDPANLPTPDSQFIAPVYLRDSAPTYTVGELAAAYAARLAANASPFNPMDDVVIGSVPAPAASTDNLSIGAGLESETALGKGWTPLKVKPNGDVAIVRSVTSRITIDGTVAATSYYDVQDFQVLYFWRKTLFTRFSQPDFKQVKASTNKAKQALGEMVRLAKLFESQEMFQAVDQLSKQFKIERSTSDRHRFDWRTPVNVIPGLHVMAGNIAASTQFDTISF